MEFEAIGTLWKIDIKSALSSPDERALFDVIHKRINDFDLRYSRFRRDSWVARLSREGGVHEMPDDFLPMLRLYERMYQITHGKMTPLVGQVLSDAGYDAEYSLIPKSLSRPPRWEDVIEYTQTSFALKQPVLLDFGAIGKGYLIDLVASMIRKATVVSFSINAGGDIVYEDAEGVHFRVGLENPENSREVVGVAEILDQSICGSSGNRRAWAGFHHIIDPETLLSPRHITALWVVAETTMLADALSTALFFAEPESLSAEYDFEYCILYPDFSFKKSAHFPGELFNR